MTSGNSIGGAGAGTGVIGAITSGGVGANGTGVGPTMTSSGVVSGSGGVGMTPGVGPMMVGGSGGVMDDQMAATGTNSSRPYDTPERRSSIRIRGQSVVNDGRNVK